VETDIKELEDQKFFTQMMNKKVSMVVDCQNRITQMEINNRNFENKVKQDNGKISSQYELMKHKIVVLQKEGGY
jgi:hypothetical protein